MWLRSLAERFRRVGRPRFTLRASLIAIALCASALGYYAYLLRGVAHDARLAAELTKAGCHVRTEAQVPSGLQWLLGEDAIQRITSINLPATAGDELMPQVASAEYLKYLFAEGTRVTDQGLQALAGNRHLTFAELNETKLANPVGLAALPWSWLNLSQTELRDEFFRQARFQGSITSMDLSATPIGDEAVRWLGMCPHLEFFGAHLTKIGDEGLRQIAQWPELVTLYLGDTRITDAGFAACDFKSKKFEVLYLENTAIGDRALEKIAEFPELRLLYLGSTLVTDRGMAHLRRLKNLEQVHFSNTRVTNATLEWLVELELLEIVMMRNTACDDQGIKRFQAARPEVGVIFRPPPGSSGSP